jgi:hypothetical protein
LISAHQNDLKTHKKNINLKQKNKKKFIFFKNTFKMQNNKQDQIQVKAILLYLGPRITKGLCVVLINKIMIYDF